MNPNTTIPNPRPSDLEFGSPCLPRFAGVYRRTHVQRFQGFDVRWGSLELGRLAALVLGTGAAGAMWGGAWWTLFGITLPLCLLSGVWFHRKWVVA